MLMQVLGDICIHMLFSLVFKCVVTVVTFDEDTASRASLSLLSSHRDVFVHPIVYFIACCISSLLFQE